MRARALATLLLAAVAGPVMGPVMGAEDVAGELRAVVERLNALDSWIDDAGKRLAEQQRQLAAADGKVAAAARRIRDLDAQIADLRATLAELEARRQRLDVDWRRQRQHLAEHLRDAWRSSGWNTVKLLLNEQDASVIERMIRYHGHLAAVRADALAEVRRTSTALAANAAALEDRRQALQTSRAAQDNARGALLAARDQRRRLVAGLGSELQAKSRQRERLGADRQRLEKLLEALPGAGSKAAGRAPRANPQKPPRNLRWPVDGRLVHRFGEPRADGRMRWQGVYMKAPLGADVRAVAGGRVVFSDWLRGFGLLAIVDHGDRRMSLYGYADTLYKRLGDRVEGGEIIASAGLSGGQQAPGLYFEIRHQGQPIDPLAWLRGRPARGAR